VVAETKHCGDTVAEPGIQQGGGGHGQKWFLQPIRGSGTSFFSFVP